MNVWSSSAGKSKRSAQSTVRRLRERIREGKTRDRSSFSQDCVIYRDFVGEGYMVQSHWSHLSSPYGNGSWDPCFRESRGIRVMNGHSVSFQDLVSSFVFLPNVIVSFVDSWTLRASFRSSTSRLLERGYLEDPAETVEPLLHNNNGRNAKLLWRESKRNKS